MAGDRQEQVECRLQSLESVMAELNVFLARLSAEVLSLKVAAVAKSKPSPLPPPPPPMRGNSSLFDTATKVVLASNLESSIANAAPHPDLQEETIESYCFHDQDEIKTGCSASDRSSSDSSFESSSIVGQQQAAEQPPRIPVYRGERDAEVIWQWIDKVESYFRVGQAGPDEKVLIAAYHLKDSAYLWWKNSSSTSSRSRSWEEFRRGLMEAFMPGNYLRQAKFALMDLRQGRSVGEYSREFCKLVVRVAGLSEEDKVAYFLHGLKRSTRMEVDEHNPRTLEEVLELAQMFESKRRTSRMC